MQFSRDDMMVMLELAAPYFDRVLSILKHTDLDFAILKTEEGKKLMKVIRNVRQLISFLLSKYFDESCEYSLHISVSF